MIWFQTVYCRLCRQYRVRPEDLAEWELELLLARRTVP